MCPYRCAYDVPLVTLMEPIPCYSQESSCACMPKFRSVAHSFLWQKFHFWLFFNIERGVAI